MGIAVKLTQAEIDSFPEKGKRDPAVLKLYRENDFLDAYASHTDSRVGINGYRGAVGSVDDWERHGDIQSRFLIDKGLEPWHRLLDIGCGTGRLARKIAPFLRNGHYMGCDISVKALDYAMKLAQEEGWASQGPQFVVGMDEERIEASPPFDFLWAFSVFVHLPCSLMADVMRVAANLMHERSKFYFSYVPEKVETRSGPKSFRHTLDCYQSCAESAELQMWKDESWPAEQSMALAVLL